MSLFLFLSNGILLCLHVILLYQHRDRHEGVLAVSQIGASVSESVLLLSLAGVETYPHVAMGTCKEIVLAG